jgi:plastocyanin
MKCRKFIILAAVLTIAVFSVSCRSKDPAAEYVGRGRVHVRQEKGGTVYWVLPAPARLDPAVFGTPDDPEMLLEPLLEKAEGPVRELLKELPILVAVPLSMRATDKEGTAFTETTVPTPFGRKSEIVSGSLSIDYYDNTPPLAGSVNTEDSIRFSAEFSDPEGNTYSITVNKLIDPPLPGYKTGGGVISHTMIHGDTGTGSPLLLRLYTYGAFWGVGNVKANGSIAAENRVIHFMTTETVRTREYRIALQKELPLSEEDTIEGQIHHTHGIVLPVTVTEQGPVYKPLNIPFRLPDGTPQPFIHIMYENDHIQKDMIEITGDEFSFNPERIDLRKGQTVTLVFHNIGTEPHNFIIDELEIMTETVFPGSSDTIEFTPPVKGMFTFYCSLPEHREQGMEGTVHIR